MTKESDARTIGYYTVVEEERTGWTGGLLVLNAAGRPLEFQCTLPVRPSKAHEILYGATLRGHLVGDIIGPMLLKKLRTPLSILCCDQPESLSLDQHLSAPIALVDEAAEPQEGPITDGTLTGWAPTEFVGSRFWVAIEQLDAVDALAKKFIDLPDAVEPFDRIREAIKEAHSQIARRKPNEAA